MATYNIEIYQQSELVDTVEVSAPRGYSAYEIAVQQGFEGTEAQWNAAVNAARVAAEDAAQIATEKADIATEKADIATTQAGIATSAASAATGSLSAFEKSYLGAKETDPSTDNDGQPLIDGAIYKNPNGLRVYDLATGTWSWVTPQGDYLLV